MYEPFLFSKALLPSTIINLRSPSLAQRTAMNTLSVILALAPILLIFLLLTVGKRAADTGGIGGGLAVVICRQNCKIQPQHRPH